MMSGPFARLLVLVALLALPQSAASADIGDSVREDLYAGRLAAAADVARERLAAEPRDGQARFALGAAEFLQAVERLGQGLHRHGLASAANPAFAGLGVPILRLPVPENPAPEKLTYAAFNDILATFAADLATAEATLSGVGEGPFDLAIDLGRIRLDLNGDGQGSEDEALLNLLQAASGLSELEAPAAAPLLVDFDASDAPWLQAYCHILMAIAEFPLAHDWQASFDATFHGIFPNAGLPSAALNEWPAALAKRGQAGEWSPELEQARMVLMMAGIADLVAFLHLNHWEVEAPERLRNVLAHLEAVPALSRENWRRILVESDDRSEWVPSPRQSGIFAQMAVTQEQVDGWMLFLDELEALLKAEKLLPHWRFEQGLNLRKMFLEPRTFDLVLLIQGSAALPYLEEGELTDRETWRRIMSLFGGNFFRYALWFN